MNNNRVTIQYAIDLDEVPETTQDLLEEAVGDIHRAHNGMGDITFDDNTSFESLADSVDRVRRLLMRADQRLADCMAIYAGYKQAIIQLSSESEQEPEAPTQQPHFHGPEMEGVAAELNQQIQDLRRQAQDLGEWGGEQE